MSTVTQNPVARIKLCDTLVSYCLHHGFDGLDLDWEGLGSTQDSVNFKNFVADLAPRLATEDLTFVITIGFGDWAGRWFPDMALQQADWLQIMAYDAAGTWDASPMDNLQHLIDADTYWTNRGYTRDKIVMSIPFYGYQFASNNGGIGLAKKYNEIVAAYPNLIDTDNRTPGNDRTCFNGPELIRRKCQYLIDSSFAGVFVWEMTQDATGDQSMHKQIVCTYEETTCIRKNPPACTTADLNDGLVSRWYFSGNNLDTMEQSSEEVFQPIDSETQTMPTCSMITHALTSNRNLTSMTLPSLHGLNCQKQITRAYNPSFKNTMPTLDLLPFT